MITFQLPPQCTDLRSAGSFQIQTFNLVTQTQVLSNQL